VGRDEHLPALFGADELLVRVDRREELLVAAAVAAREDPESVFEGLLIHAEATGPGLELGLHRRVGPGAAVQPALGGGERGERDGHEMERDQDGADLRPPIAHRYRFTLRYSA
jgi:hypothetical protein